MAEFSSPNCSYSSEQWPEYSVCSGHGICVNDTCICNDLFVGFNDLLNTNGLDCQIYIPLVIVIWAMNALMLLFHLYLHAFYYISTYHRTKLSIDSPFTVAHSIQSAAHKPSPIGLPISSPLSPAPSLPITAQVSPGLSSHLHPESFLLSPPSRQASPLLAAPMQSDSGHIPADAIQLPLPGQVLAPLLTEIQENSSEVLPANEHERRRRPSFYQLRNSSATNLSGVQSSDGESLLNSSSASRRMRLTSCACSTVANHLPRNSPGPVFASPTLLSYLTCQCFPLVPVTELADDVEDDTKEQPPQQQQQLPRWKIVKVMFSGLKSNGGFNFKVVRLASVLYCIVSLAYNLIRVFGTYWHSDYAIANSLVVTVGHFCYHLTVANWDWWCTQTIIGTSLRSVSEFLDNPIPNLASSPGDVVSIGLTPPPRSATGNDLSAENDQLKDELKNKSAATESGQSRAESEAKQRKMAKQLLSVFRISHSFSLCVKLLFVAIIFGPFLGGEPNWTLQQQVSVLYHSGVVWWAATILWIYYSPGQRVLLVIEWVRDNNPSNTAKYAKIVNTYQRTKAMRDSVMTAALSGLLVEIVTLAWLPVRLHESYVRGAGEMILTAICVTVTWQRNNIELAEMSANGRLVDEKDSSKIANRAIIIPLAPPASMNDGPAIAIPRAALGNPTQSALTNPAGSPANIGSALPSSSFPVSGKSRMAVELSAAIDRYG